MPPRAVHVAVQVLLGLVLVGLTWASLFSDMFTTVGLPLTGWAAVVLAMLRSPAGWFLLLTPLPVLAGLDSTMAAWSYAAGVPTLQAANGYSSVDPETRLGVTRYVSCVRADDDWLLDLTHDVTLRAMVRVLGPPRGAYLGPLPSKWGLDVVLAERGEPIRLDDLKAGTVLTMEGRVVAELGPDLGGTVLTSTEFRVNQGVPSLGDIDADRPLAGSYGYVAEIAEGTLVFRICADLGAVVLVDTMGRDIVAKYGDPCRSEDLAGPWVLAAGDP